VKVGDDATTRAVQVLLPASYARMRQVCAYPTSVGSQLLEDHEVERAMDGEGREIDVGMLRRRGL
jgi:hypothetical protein